VPVKPALSITVLVDDTTVDASDPQFIHSNPEGKTEYAVIRALRALGYPVYVLPVDDSVDPIVKQLHENPPGLIFNLTETFRSQRKFDRNIAALLELMQIPFTGTGSAGLMLCRDKSLSKNLLRANDIPVPAFFTIDPGKPLIIPGCLSFPLVVKPLYEDGSDGISNGSFVKSEEELRERVAMIHEHFREPAIAEEYIEGRELYIGLVGNSNVRMLPVRELHFGATEGGPVLATFKVKWDREYQKKWNISFGFGQIDESIEKQLDQICCRAYHVLQMVDYGRIDVRLTNDNKIYVLEANPNPGIGPDDEIAKAARKTGIPYEDLIQELLDLALDRNGRAKKSLKVTRSANAC